MTYFIVLIRPVGSNCWTTERIAKSRAVAEQYAVEERNKKLRFADGSMHLQSTAIVELDLPGDPDKTQQHYDPLNIGNTMRGIP